MSKPLIKRVVGADGAQVYKHRTIYDYRELLVHLPNEMLEAKKQLGKEAECYGTFWVNGINQLVCRITLPTAEGPTPLYTWSTTRNLWILRS